MLTGTGPLGGADHISLLAAILQQEPPTARQIVPALPSELDRIIRRCLRKDPERRFQHMDDVRVALQDLKEESESGRLLSPLPVALPRARVSKFHIVAVAVLVACAAAATWWMSRPKP